MRNHELAMLTYAQLSRVSHAKIQAPARDRFLILCGAEACRAGWLEVADRCGQLIRRHQPGHLLADFPNFAEAMRDESFIRLVKRWERWCPFERAEQLWRGSGDSGSHGQDSLSSETASAGKSALQLLAGIDDGYPTPDIDRESR